MLLFGSICCDRNYRTRQEISLSFFFEEVTTLKRDLRDMKFEIQDIQNKFESEIRDIKNKHKSEIDANTNVIQNIQNKYESEIRDIKNMHKSEIDAIKNDQERQLTKIRDRLTDLEQNLNHRDPYDSNEFDDNSYESDSLDSNSPKGRLCQNCVSVPKFEKLEKRFNDIKFSNFISLDDVLTELQTFKEECEDTMLGKFEQYFAALDCYIGDLKESQIMKDNYVYSIGRCRYSEAFD